MIPITPAGARVPIQARAHVRRRSVIPGGDEGLVRRRVTTTSFFPEEHVILKGFPYQPKFMVSSDYLISANGSYVPDRLYPWDAVFEGAHTRFIATDTFDSISGKWNPFYSAGVNYYFTSPTTPQPFLEEIEYQIGKQFYTTNGIRITPGGYLESSFNDSLDDASSFMIAMAGIIHSSERAALLSVGVSSGSSIEISADEYLYVRNQYDTATFKTAVHPSKMLPFFMVLVNNPERTELQVSTGPNRTNRIIIPNRDVSRDLKVTVGKTVGGTATLDADIFELTVFPYAYGGDMSPEQILGRMAAIYGSST